MCFEWQELNKLNQALVSLVWHRGVERGQSLYSWSGYHEVILSEIISCLLVAPLVYSIFLINSALYGSLKATITTKYCTTESHYQQTVIRPPSLIPLSLTITDTSISDIPISDSSNSNFLHL